MKARIAFVAGGILGIWLGIGDSQANFSPKKQPCAERCQKKLDKCNERRGSECTLDYVYCMAGCKDRYANIPITDTPTWSTRGLISK